MTIWFLFALMTGAVILAVLLPLSRRPRTAGGGVDDAAFFRDQIADIEREVARGLMPAAEGEAARAEAARRLLRAVSEEPDDGDQKGEPALRRRRAASAIAISSIPLVALTLYGALGHPDVPDAPLAGRMTVDDPRALGLNEAVARVEGHLARQPDDGRGWEVLAPIYMRAGRFNDAVRAFGEALRLNGETSNRLANLGEALVMAGDGVVTADARAAFDRALKADPANVKAAYYLAIAADQDGDRAGALARLRELVASAPADAPWRSMVAARIAALEDPTRTDAGRAIAGLAPEERMQAIRGMVAQLAARVEADDGASLDDWLQLIRSYAVLGDRAGASRTVASARARFAADTQALRAVETLAGELQITDERAPAEPAARPEGESGQ
ncbi:c-type cytochrome biogenesis protein CcmI [Pseudochelatococcus sp. B33]